MDSRRISLVSPSVSGQRSTMGEVLFIPSSVTNVSTWNTGPVGKLSTCNTRVILPQISELYDATNFIGADEAGQMYDSLRAGVLFLCREGSIYERAQCSTYTDIWNTVSDKEYLVLPATLFHNTCPQMYVEQRSKYKCVEHRFMYDILNLPETLFRISYTVSKTLFYITRSKCSWNAVLHILHGIWNTASPG